MANDRLHTNTVMTEIRSDMNAATASGQPLNSVGLLVVQDGTLVDYLKGLLQADLPAILISVENTTVDDDTVDRGVAVVTEQIRFTYVRDPSGDANPETAKRAPVLTIANWLRDTNIIPTATGFEWRFQSTPEIDWNPGVESELQDALDRVKAVDMTWQYRYFGGVA